MNLVRLTGRTFLLLGLLTACGAPNLGAAVRPEAPALQTRDGQVGEAAPGEALDALIVNWSNASRGKLEAAAQKGVVAVEYRKGSLRVVPYCRSKATYAYSAFAPKVEKVAIRDESQLAATLPLGFADLKGSLKSSGEIGISMTLVGRFEGPRESLEATELEGDCASATHVVSGISVGAFDIHTGTKGSVAGSAAANGPVRAGASASSDSTMDTLNRDGEVASCGQGKGGDTSPPDACRAFVRVEIQPIKRAAGVAAPALARPSCGAGTAYVQGAGCLRTGFADSLLGQGSLTLASNILNNECKVSPKPKYTGQPKDVVAKYRADVPLLLACDQKLDAAQAKCTDPTCIYGMKLNRGRLFTTYFAAVDEMKVDMPPALVAKIKSAASIDPDLPAEMKATFDSTVDDFTYREKKAIGELAMRPYAEAYALAKAQNAGAAFTKEPLEKLAYLEEKSDPDAIVRWVAGIDGLNYKLGDFEASQGRLSKYVVRDVMFAAKARLDTCKSKGKVVDGFFLFGITVGAGGKVTEATRKPFSPKSGPPADDQAVTDCLGAEIRKLVFPLPAGVSSVTTEVAGSLPTR